MYKPSCTVLIVGTAGWLKLAVRQEEEPVTTPILSESPVLPPLGSPFQLANNGSRHYTRQLSELDLVSSVKLCDADVVAEFRKAALPLFPGGLTSPKTPKFPSTPPTQRHKTSRFTGATPPLRDEVKAHSSPSPQEKAGLRCGNVAVPAVIRPTGVLWPKVHEKK
jgi:hypothetical protein